MDPSGKGPSRVQGSNPGLFRDPKELHQLYVMAPAPEEQEMEMGRAGKGPSRVQGFVTPKGITSPNPGLFNDPKELHQLYVMASAPEKRRDGDGEGGDGTGSVPWAPPHLLHWGNH